MMPSVSLLCSSFLEHLSGRNDPEPEEEDADTTNMEVDHSSSDDEEVRRSQSPSLQQPEFWTANYEVVKEKRLRKISKQPLFFDSLELFVS